MDPFETRPLGRTAVRVTRLGLGGGTLGDPAEVIGEAQADLTVETAYAAGIGHFDTSPWYGNGKSEHRLGRVLRTKPRDSFVLSTKVGRSRPFRPVNSIRNTAAAISASILASNSTIAAAVPPVAIRSSTTTTRLPAGIRSAEISIVSLPYSRL
jgi:aryl-alcohol dehydrogenase-like predicted oxidoreductase